MTTSSSPIPKFGKLKEGEGSGVGHFAAWRSSQLSRPLSGDNPRCHTLQHGAAHLEAFWYE